MESTRRHFIRTAGASAVLYQLAGPKPQLRAAGPNDQIGVGFIGVGIRGSYHLDNFKKMPGVRPIMAADCFDGHLDWAKETTEGKIETTRDYHALLARKDIDAVVIATPEHWHARMMLDAMAAGKHIYVEKPMTLTIAEGKTLCEAAKKSGKLVMVGSQNKTSTLTAKAREMVKSGALGKVNMVRLATYRNTPEGAWVYPISPDASPKTIDWARWLGPAPKHEFDLTRFFRWRCFWEYSGGVATDLWVHELTTMHEVMDVKAPRSAVAQGGIYRFDDGRTVPDLLTGVYDYPGFILEITANLGNSTRAAGGMLIMGSEGTLTSTGRGLTVTYEPPASPIAALRAQRVDQSRQREIPGIHRLRRWETAAVAAREAAADVRGGAGSGAPRASSSSRSAKARRAGRRPKRATTRPARRTWAIWRSVRSAV